MEIPDTPYALFLRGELDDALDRPDDGSRVEVIGGEIVVSPAPKNAHRRIVQQLSDLFAQTRILRTDFGWGVDQGPNLDLVGFEEGFIPDLIVAEQALLDGEMQTGNLCLVADEVELAVEVTSRSTARNDRPPVKDGPPTKWTGYARAEIPYYLLIDCDPRLARVVLYSIPDGKAGVYLDRQEWVFGELVKLPEPFDLEIPTDRWAPWQ
ncbi:Uma2 family endonuclease [Actinocorallia lasiicapitis]